MFKSIDVRVLVLCALDYFFTGTNKEEEVIMYSLSASFSSLLEYMG